MAKFNEKKYMRAIKDLVHQSALMIEEDFPNADAEEFEFQLRDYLAQADTDINDCVRDVLKTKVGE